MKTALIRATAAAAIACTATLAIAAGPQKAKAASVAPPQAATATLDPAYVTGKPSDYRLGPGDQIKVQVYQSPDLALEARVSETGVINYPLVGRVTIGGLSIPDAESRIAQALRKNNILKAPQVNINLITVRGNQVAVLGQVQKPGRFPLETTNIRVSDMLAAAGGVAPNGDDVLVVSGVRNRRPFSKQVDLQSLFAGKGSGDDILVAPGDTLYVAKAPVFYIYGEAQRPGPYRVERGMTVMQAIAQGGGITPRGSQNRLKLHRTGPDGNVVQLTPTLTDTVQPGDVLFVRESIF